MNETLARWNREEEALGVPAPHRSFARPGPAHAPCVLLLHGGGGSPADFPGLAHDLAGLGVRVLCPLLPAHGLGERALGDLRFDTMLARAHEAQRLLAAEGGPVILVAQSLGAIVGIRLVAESDVAGFVALAPAVRPFVLRRLGRLAVQLFTDPELVRLTWTWQMRARKDIRRAIGRLGRVRCPLLVLHSRDDDSVHPRGAREFVDAAGSAEKRLEMLDGQGHVLSMAPDRHRVVFPPIRDFVESITGASAPRTRSPDPRP